MFAVKVEVVKCNNEKKLKRVVTIILAFLHPRNNEKKLKHCEEDEECDFAQGNNEKKLKRFSL